MDAAGSRALKEYIEARGRGMRESAPDDDAAAPDPKADEATSAPEPAADAPAAPLIHR
jgi:hypothetical protein